MRFPLHPPSSRVLCQRAVSGLVALIITPNRSAMKSAYEAALMRHKSRRSDHRPYCGSEATAPRNYGNVLAFNRLTIQGPNCPIPPWSRVVGEPRTPRGSFISVVIYGPRAAVRLAE